jgi:hypothetical protein
MFLDGFPREGRARPVYYAVEGHATVSFVVRRGGHDCSGRAASVRYIGVDVTARSGADYAEVRGKAVLNDPHVRPPWFKEVPVPVVDDRRVEAGIEKATIRLRRPTGAVLGSPHSAPLYIVDDDARRTGISFAERSYRQGRGRSFVAIPVFRSGDGSESASARYVARRGRKSVRLARGRVVFAPGERIQLLRFSLGRRADRRSTAVRVSLRGRDVVRPSSTSVVVTGSDGVPPASRFHHPKNGRRYPHNDYRVREIHVFTKDAGGSKVARAHLALRRRKTNGSCAWWNGRRFRRGACADKSWVRMRVYEAGYFYFYRIHSLRPSVGTRIRDYTSFSRAVDRAGNRERRFERGRNANTFEVAGRR